MKEGKGIFVDIERGSILFEEAGLTSSDGLIRADQVSISTKKLFVPVEEFVNEIVTKEAVWFDSAEYEVKGTVLLDSGKIAITVNKVLLGGKMSDRQVVEFRPDYKLFTSEKLCKTVCLNMNEQEAKRHQKKLDEILEKQIQYEEMASFYKELKKVVSE